MGGYEKAKEDIDKAWNLANIEIQSLSKIQFMTDDSRPGLNKIGRSLYDSVYQNHTEELNMQIQGIFSRNE